ncbi:MAG: serine/threonine protein kinase, partial [Planctomycetes bacterium]|nr:serine/threonine protein kinase [Planctomycetota bacterium]
DQKRPSETASGIYQCVACREKAQKAGVQKPRRRPPSTCTMCGRDVSSEVTGNRQGEFICVACKADPFEILKGILKLANAGDKELLPIQGYVVKRELGRGGMGAAFLARHEKTGERVALKVMLPRVPASEHAKQSFLREMENTKLLKHRNIVQFKAGGCGNGTFFLAVEYCDRGTLAKLMQSHGGKLAIDDATGIVLQALDGLEYAHNAEIPYIKLIDGSIGRGRGLVHRDLKPSNIFLTGSGSGRIAKIGDYGLAKAFDMAGLSGCTRTGLAAGTPVFLPRQQVGNFKYAKPEVDVWAMAATLYYMLTGTVPRDFPKGRDPWQVVLQSKPVPIRQRDASIPRRLAEVIDQALIDEPEIGFKTALEFKLQLEHALR